MKYLLISIALLLSGIGKSQTADTASQKKDTVKAVKHTLEGIVSHKYKECGTVILVYNKQRHDTTILIPMGSSLKDYDIDGLVITFQSRHLMIHNPKGCVRGSPVIVYDVAKKETPKKAKKKKQTIAK
ncbi:MAG TPA: hypothetical protein VK806_03815 [Bacteroidia bacterium]|jgi:hypothetical protein|nr:hypothetical protein [Bacteroidia bacterium]